MASGAASKALAWCSSSWVGNYGIWDLALGFSNYGFRDAISNDFSLRGPQLKVISLEVWLWKDPLLASCRLWPTKSTMMRLSLVYFHCKNSLCFSGYCQSFCRCRSYAAQQHPFSRHSCFSPVVAAGSAGCRRPAHTRNCPRSKAKTLRLYLVCVLSQTNASAVGRGIL